MEAFVSKKPMHILVVDDEPNIRRMLIESLTLDGHRVHSASNGRDALAEAARASFDVAFVDVRLGAESGLDLIPQLIAESPWIKVVVITAFASIDTAVEAMKRGASDYVVKPFTPAQLRVVLERTAEMRELENRPTGLENVLGDTEGILELDSLTPDVRRAFDMARQVAPSEASVLIRGESGTGKGVLARAIHGWSKRAVKPFATIACPSLSLQLLESELFGHVKGAFTGAVRDNTGRVAAAEGGTLFLDEIGDLPLTLQPKLLRLVQEREYERVGDTNTRRADVRVIAATNVDLSEAVKAGRFREDLLYRINVIEINLPPLRERKEDIVSLARRMLAHFSQQRPITGFTEDAIAALKGYEWPGNVRELRNVIERAVILCHTERIGVEHVPSKFSTVPAEPKVGDPVPFEQIEAIHIRRLIASSNSMANAARALGIDTATLWRKRKKFGI